MHGCLAYKVQDRLKGKKKKSGSQGPALFLVKIDPTNACSPIPKTMRQTYYWNTKNVSNFVRELNEKPTTYEKDVRFLANYAGISVKEFQRTDPISYGVMLWGNYSTPWGTTEPSQRIRQVIGDAYYRNYFLSYHVKELRRRDELRKNRAVELPLLPQSPALPPLPLTPTLSGIALLSDEVSSFNLDE